jgi:hypothetical protein
MYLAVILLLLFLFLLNANSKSSHLSKVNCVSIFLLYVVTRLARLLTVIFFLIYFVIQLYL